MNLDFKSLLKWLLPPGEYFEIEKDTTADSFFDALSVELNRVNDRTLNLIVEADPSTTTELIEDWERNVGLPLPCFDDIADTIEQRRLDILAALRARGGQSKAYYVAIASAAGYDITIDDNIPQFRAGDPIGERVGGDGLRYRFIVDATNATITLDVGNERLECLIAIYKPAHTVPIYQYNEAVFRAGSRAGDRLRRIIPN